MTTTASTIDFDQIRAAADLESIITADLGQPAPGRRWLCPYHEDRHPSLALTPDRRHWRCWSCGERGDVLDWVTRREGIPLVEAVRQLDPTAAPDPWEMPVSHRPPATSPTSPAGASAAPPQVDRPSAPTEPAWLNPEWQAAVDRIVYQAEAALWSSDGRRALDWLRSRGLADCTITRFRLGYVASDFNTDPIGVLGHDDRGRPKRLWVRRGILLPWVAPQAVYSATVECEHRWVGANVRRLAADPFSPIDSPKCMALAGSTRGYLYPWPEIMSSQGIRPALLCEGEIDALLAEQAAGHLVIVGTVGGANQNPHRKALAALARCPVWLIAMDHDEAGVEAARAWRERAPHKARRVLLPWGKDLGEFVQSGGDIVTWLREITL
jgi:DNA primase